MTSLIQKGANMSRCPFSPQQFPNSEILFGITNSTAYEVAAAVAACHLLIYGDFHWTLLALP